MSFKERFYNAIKKQESLLCIGLDPLKGKLPQHIVGETTPFFLFNREIIDATHDLVCAYKPNTAYYEARGSQGIEELKMTCDYIKLNFPHILLILDAKRGDIGHTNEAYANFAFNYLGADAITLHPYTGREGLKPFLDRTDKGCIILCRTSNPGSGEFQNLMIEENQGKGKPLYKHIAHTVAHEWNKAGNCMIVAGATHTEELTAIRDIAGEMPILVPGVGAQGGDLQATLKAGLSEAKNNLIITVSRTILYSSHLEDFADKARAEAKCIRDIIEEFRN